MISHHLTLATHTEDGDTFSQYNYLQFTDETYEALSDQLWLPGRLTDLFSTQITLWSWALPPWYLQTIKLLSDNKFWLIRFLCREKCNDKISPNSIGVTEWNDHLKALN